MIMKVWVKLRVQLHYLNFRKGGFFMIDLTWKLFSQTGDIETYLLYKELESEQGHTNYSMKENEEESPLETNL